MIRLFRRRATSTVAASAVRPDNPIDYDDAIHLDAEELAEGGMSEANANVVPAIRTWVPNPLRMHDELDDETASYWVHVGDDRHSVYGAEVDDNDVWGRATVVFFDVVNEQLAHTPVRLFALNEGNDLHAVVLTPEQAEQARLALERPTDWPYLPTGEAPWFGQPH